MLYVGERVTATRQVGVPLDYACDCGFKSKVFAIGRGVAQAQNPFLFETGADERAGDAAFYAAHRSAREAVALVRCPRCGSRNGSAWRSFRIKATLTLVGALALPVGFGAVFTLLGESFVGWVMAVVTPFLLGILYRGIRWRYKTAEARVAFEPPRLEHRRRHEPSAGAWFEQPH